MVKTPPAQIGPATDSCDGLTDGPMHARAPDLNGDVGTATVRSVVGSYVLINDQLPSLHFRLASGRGGGPRRHDSESKAERGMPDA